MNSKIKKFRFNTNVYYEDTDAGGIVYHTSYLKFAERARTELLKKIYPELLETLKETDFFFVLKNIQVDFLKPCYLFDELLIETSVLEIKKTYVRMNQIIKRKNLITCDIFLTLVWLNKTKKKPSKMSENLISRFKGL